MTTFLHIVKRSFAFFQTSISAVVRLPIARIALILVGLIGATSAFAQIKIEQPIEFPHDIHAGKMNINCMYCHTYARRSNVSGIPPLRKCIGCHQNIESVREKPRIKKLFEYWEKKEAIPWKKVHDEPEFVRFSHQRHIQRFIFTLDRPVQEVCGYCHGDVKGMTVDQKVKPITMGWCIDCHKQDHPVSNTSAKTSHGPNDCWQCHK